MTWVKACGLQEEADVAAAVEAGADAVGFVLAEGSHRQVSVDRAAALMDGVPVRRVLVTTHMAPVELAEAVAATGADAIQAHGEHARAAAVAGVAAGWLVLRPVAMGGDRPDPDPGTIPEGQIPILDSVEGARLGGTGTMFDWTTIPELGRSFVLAGGLTPENVASAIRTAGPWGVDASSGLEAERGVKDTGRVVAFIQEAKQA
jgi:phosphoribosylanthranilate isomerase